MWGNIIAARIRKKPWLQKVNIRIPSKTMLKRYPEKLYIFIEKLATGNNEKINFKLNLSG